jgi:probable HAF family extracellular repeat protein
MGLRPLLYPMKNRYAIRLNRADEMRSQASRVFLVLKSIGLMCTICLASAAFAQNRYQITRIPTAQGANSAALGVNDKGEVVGYSFQGEDYRAFLYSSSDQSLTDVGSLGGKINAACAINDAGQITGYSQDENGNLLAFIFSRQQPIASLGTLEGASTSEAFGVNNSGAVVGDSQSGNQNHRPVLFSNRSVQDLNLGRSNNPVALETAFAINDAGQIVGRHSAGNNAFHAFVFVNGNTTDFSTLGGANGEALAINKSGIVVGDSDTADGPAHAVVFGHSQLKDLGTLPGFDNASYARGINDSGDIVGESDSANQKRAFVYTKGHLFELDKLAENLPEAGFSSLDVAYGINHNGWIVGYGTTSDNLTAAFVAIPEGRGNQGQVGRQPRGQVQHVSESNQQDYDVFYTRLSSEDGNWVEAGNYGYCFRPRVSEDWRPYEDGHWIWTDHGWYWDSNEPFAWATYHYGRWVDIRGTGWCWVPGNQWAPAWVSWRESDEDVGWAPLPPEADISEQQPISSWSDSYYDIGPAAYVFISYAHWHEPSYEQFIESPERNIQIISETKNVTNIVTNNNVINNFGPPVQTVATKTRQNIQQVKLALNPAIDPKANYGQTVRGNQLNVVAPPATLKSQATHAPPVQNRIESPQIEKGWQGVKPQDAEKLKKAIAEQNPPPKELPKPTPFVNPQFGKKGQVTGSHGATGSPTAVAGQKTPPNLVKPGAGSSNANVTLGASPTAAAAEKKSVPPNLLGAKRSAVPGQKTPPNLVKPGAGSPSANVPPGASPTAAAAEKKSVPPNLLGAKPSGTPGGSPIGPGGKLTTPSSPAHSSVTPHTVATPTQEKKPETTAIPTAPGGPANLATPKLTSTPHREPAAGPKPTPEAKATPPPKKEVKTPPPQVQHTPSPQGRVLHTHPAQPQSQKAHEQQQVIHKAHPVSPSPPHVAQAPHPQPPPHVAQAPHPQPPPHVAQAPHPQPPPHVAQAPHPQPPPHVAQAPHPQPQPHPAANNKDQKKKNPPQR